MTRIVTGSFEEFADAARGVSALMDRGFGHGEISIVSVRASDAGEPLPREQVEARTGTFLVGAVGAMIGSGSALAWAPPDAGVWVASWAPTIGALIGVAVGLLLAAFSILWRRTAHRDAEAVSVVVDDLRAARVEAILRAHGATLRRGHALRRRNEAGRSRSLNVVPFRP
jgi:hypothetical protein